MILRECIQFALPELTRLTRQPDVVIGFFLFVLALALWHHFRGRYIIWTTPTSTVGWFDGPSAGKFQLPRPVTDKRKRYGDKDGKYKEIDDEKLYTALPAITRNDSRKGKGYDLDTKPLVLPARAHTRGRPGDEHKLWIPLPTSQKPGTKDYGKIVSPPPAPPIARKFSETRRQDTPATAQQHERRPSQREKFDQARQEARRVRSDQALGVGPRRQDSSSRRPHAEPNPATTTAPAIARKPSANAGRPRPEARARPELVAVRPAAGVQRHGSSSRPQPQQTVGPGIERQPSNPFRNPPGRRV